MNEWICYDKYHIFSLILSPPQLDINITLPLHRRASRNTNTPFNVTIPIPHFYAQTPVRDSVLVGIMIKIMNMNMNINMNINMRLH